MQDLLQSLQRCGQGRPVRHLSFLCFSRGPALPFRCWGCLCVTKVIFQAALQRKNPRVLSMIAGTSYFCFLERWIGYWWQDDGKAPVSFCFWMSGVACLVTPLQGKESEHEEEKLQKCHQRGGGGLFWKGLTRAIKAGRLAGGRVLISKVRVERPKVLLLKSFRGS